MSKLSEAEKKHLEERWGYSHENSLKNWRAWGSWFSWGSPIGLALFYAIVTLSTAGFVWILRQN